MLGQPEVAVFAVLLLVSSVLSLVGFVSLIYPLKIIGIRTRKTAMQILVISLLLAGVGGAIAPAPNKDRETPPVVPSEAGAENKSAPVVEVQTCRSEWKLCASNSDFVEHSGRWTEIVAACELEGNGRAKYGSPKWPSWTSGGAFARFATEPDFRSTGVATAVELDAQFENMYGAMMHARVNCSYDIGAKKVVDYAIIPR